ncbi:MAG TPA: hypothetical protein GX707_10385 [Epulopiscium sp.]|nr:hypothetical protein [Candidatus Epulonipiscium sp.]
MQTGALNYNKCKKCGNPFVVGWESKHLESYCADCENEGWFEDMKREGCNVVDPTKLGQIPHMIPKKKKELPVVHIKGEKYLDVMDFVFESNRHRKIYPNAKEREKIQKYEGRKKTVTQKDKVKMVELESIISGSNDNRATVKELRNMGHHGEKIRTGLGLTNFEYGAIIKDLRDSGEITVATKKSYSREEELLILKMAGQGVDIKAIAEKLGRNEKAVQSKLDRLRKIRLC